MEINHLRQIVAIADAGSFSRAAQALSLTQPALSRNVAAVERRYGIRLFERGRKGAECTAAGTYFIEQARGVLAALSTLEGNVEAFSHGASGALSIGLSPGLASLALSRLIVELRKSGMEFALRSTILSPDRLLEDLLSHSLEAFFGSGWQAQSLEVSSAPIGSIPMALLVRGDHPLAKRKALRSRDLLDFPVAGFGGTLPTSFLGTTAPSFHCDNHHILREVALNSDHILLSSPAFARAEVSAGALVVLRVSDLVVPDSEVRMFSRRGAPAPFPVKVISQLIKSILNDLMSA